MLERYIFFVSKQPLLVELSDVHQVVFSRVSAAAAGRTFDIKIVTKSGPEHSFTSINKEEHEVTEAYLRDKKIRVKNEMVPDADLLLAAVGADDDDDDDDDMASVASDDLYSNFHTDDTHTFCNNHVAFHREILQSPLRDSLYLLLA